LRAATACRRLKADHLKKRADQALREGDARLAWETYAEAIETTPSKDGLAALHSNRSLALARARRYADALADADAAAALAPRWSKGHWRRGAALTGLKHFPEAALAYLQAWRCAQGGSADEGAECEGKVAEAVHRMTREQLGDGFLRLFEQLQQEERMRAAEVEAVSEVEMLEAWFRLVGQPAPGRPRPGPFHRRYLLALKAGLRPEEAYALRAAIFARAKCYLQAASDARAAVALLCAAPGGGGGGGGDGRRLELGEAHLRLGEALLAEPDHEDRDCFQAFKALTRGSGALEDALASAALRRRKK
jgi:tetratricopeptide (TPR) repeat protein